MRIATAFVASVLLGLAAFSPIWGAHLVAPQYPAGLGIRITATSIDGDLDEINELNHYVGMRPFRLEETPEVKLWYPTLAVAIVAAIVAGVARREWQRRLALLILWSIPLGVLVDIQIRLYGFGHDLDPAAALRIDPFIPWVIGPTKVWNFTTWAYPGPGLFLVAGAAVISAFGVRGLRAMRACRKAVVVCVAAGAVLASAAGPASASEAHPHHRDGDVASRLATARAGQTVELRAGTYEGRFVIRRGITLKGVGNPVLRGDGRGTVLTIAAPNVRVEGIVVERSGPGPLGSPAGIRVGANDALIRDVVIRDAYIGISANGVSGLVVERVRILGSGRNIGDESHAVSHDSGHDGAAAAAASTHGDGIALQDTRETLVRDTRMIGVRDGIYVSFGSEILLDRNVIAGSRYGIHSMFARELTLAENMMNGNRAGAVLMYGGPILMLRNHATDNRSSSTGFGLLVKDVSALQATQNIFAGDRVGMQFDGPAGGRPGDIQLIGNIVAQNAVGVGLFPSARATFTQNAFADNTVQVLPMGSGVAGKSAWSSRGAGNFWSSYRGFDRRRDGIGDIAHLEGGLIAKSYVRDPMIAALVTAPGSMLLRTIQERWIAAAPVLVDELPLAKPPHVKAMFMHGARTSASQAPRAVGATLLLISGVCAAALRGTRPRIRDRVEVHHGCV